MSGPDLDERRRLCSIAVTLDGKPAVISGAQERYASVRQIPEGFGAHWSWEAVASIVERGGDFRS